jgi:hypothetical protein
MATLRTTMAPGVLCLALSALLAAASAPAAALDDENVDGYEEAYLAACQRSGAFAPCDCTMEMVERELTIDRFARLVRDGWATLNADPAYQRAKRAAAAICAPTLQAVRKDDPAASGSSMAPTAAR